MLEEVNQLLADVSVDLHISENAILTVLSRIAAISEDELLRTMQITLKENLIYMQGKIKKMGVPIAFSMQIKPIQAKGRTLYFQVVDMKPLNQSWIKKKLLQAEPIMTFQNEMIRIDCNQIEEMRRLPFGGIKRFQVKEKKIVIELGL